MPCTPLALATARVMPWKNGGGETLELAIAPAGAGLEDFQWRISSARVGAAGPFSAFAGVDRSLALLSGAGLRLQRGDGRIEELHAGGAVAQFAGEEAITASLVDGPVGDLNLMTRRGTWRHRLAPLRLHGRQELHNDAAVMLLWCQAGAGIECRLPDGEMQRLESGQGLLLEDQPGLLALQAAQPALLYLAWLYRQG
ncbi:HutD/Ves family protein [Pseudomonas sp. SP16.1]|uniref:HutD/Ves family protein n=1 Tax=Pseudomonas sp. SP16.1 TaxID=3458854 RepID=UPI0040465047